MINRIKAPALTVAAALALSGCVGGLLDVDNPNSLVESSIELPAAANGVANGSLRLVSEAVANVWEAPGVVADELYWTGSRDAWGQLDQGYIGDPLNEFTDGAFPFLGQATWMANNAVDILTTHVADNPGVDSYAKDLARAQMFQGLVLMVTGEIQEDMTFSNKQEDGPAVGPANMGGVIDDAIGLLDQAISGFNALGEDDLVTVATSIRARAKMSRVIWDQINPSASVTGALDFSSAAGDAQAVLDDVGTADWFYNLGFTEASTSCSLCSDVNNRGENQIDASLVENDGPGATGRTGVVVLTDPVTGDPDPAVAREMVQFGDDQYADLTITSARLMHLILAETALAGSDFPEFEAQINAIRAFDGYTADFVQGGPVADLAMLQHTRRVNTLVMGLRLQDMYRWGLSDPHWQAGSEAVSNPGEMLPITIVECRANANLDPSNC